MKKVLVIAFILGISLNAFSQKSYTIKKMGTAGFKVKVDGNIVITDSTVSVKADYKGNITDVTFKIVNKSEHPNASSYQCTGMFGTGDKHVFSIIPQTKTVIWKSISSFDNTSAEQFIAIE
jgi:hypothetical protein